MAAELTIRHGKLAFITTLPAGADPAEWLSATTPTRLDAFDRPPPDLPAKRPFPSFPAESSPGSPSQHRRPRRYTAPANGVVDGPERVANVCRQLIPLLHQLPPAARPSGCSSSPSPR